MVRLTDRPDMTLDVYLGRKTTMQQGFLISRFKRYLKEATDGASLMSSGKVFQALIAEGKKEL